MCGIVGVYSPAPVERARLGRALQTMRSRGPDGFGEWWSDDGRVGLGHALLSVRSEWGAEQPVEHERFVAVVNGEFYAIPEAYKQRDKSDSHSLPLLLEAEGRERGLQKLRGEFAFLVYDRLEKTFLAVRDRFGIKPLFWARRGEEYWFASKASALWAAGIERGWRTESFLHAACTQYPPSGESLFEDIKSIRPGHYLELIRDELSHRRYWRVPDLAKQNPTQAFEELLLESVSLRMKRKGKTAVLLSGGVDSASIVGLAARTGEDLAAYTINFSYPEEPLFSEGNLAMQQAEAVGIEHNMIDITSEEIVDGIWRTACLTEGLMVNGHGVARRKLAERIQRDGIRVLLSGEGADELLFGYRHFRGYFASPASINCSDDPAGLGILVPPEERSQVSDHWPSFFAAKRELGQKICSFLKSDLLGRDYFKQSLQLSSEVKREHPIETARDAWLDSALRAYILEVLGDGTEMPHSVEGRLPFLDHHLWEQYPGQSVLQGSGQKDVLRQSMKPYLVDSILQKAKHPFMAPPLGERLISSVEGALEDCEHPFVCLSKSRAAIKKLRSLRGREQLVWEPALIWILSSLAIQENWLKGR